MNELPIPLKSEIAYPSFAPPAAGQTECSSAASLRHAGGRCY